ncbi:DDE-type integrase/transposase/recombinase [Rhodococcus sp. IEGM 1379]|uniref:DDE-type integrase/transposase/recombinase n=1 Tax=Rhodococcus sp. IEGM 1379 TaxID=3047086 RepID=UPI0032D58500
MRDGKAATRFFKKLLKRQGHPPRALITNKLANYHVAHRTTMSTVGHRQNKYLNNRCENFHQPTRQRKRAMKGFRAVVAAQRFLAAFSCISPHFRLPRHRMPPASTAPKPQSDSTSGIRSLNRPSLPDRPLRVVPCCTRKYRAVQP